MLIVFGALKIELIPILKMIHVYNIQRTGKTIIYKGYRNSRPVTIIQTGMGAENAKRAAKLFKDNHLDYTKNSSNPIEILMIGFCGAADGSLKVGDTVVYGSIKNITRSSGKEFSLSGSLDLEKGRPVHHLVKDALYVIGATVTEVITGPAIKKKLNTSFNIQAIDMESYPVAETILGMNLPFSCISIVSDGARDLLPSYLGSSTRFKMATDIILSLLRSIFDRKEFIANKNTISNLRKANRRLTKLSADLISALLTDTLNNTL